MTGYDEVLFSTLPGIDGDIGSITLNRPAVLNSLNHSMIKAMTKQLHLWAEADHIKAVIIQAAKGRAFCAGGDLRYTYDRWLHQDTTLVDFFRDEYQLNRLIYHFPKPYIALIDGIDMGGGVGISIHGSHRVVTENFLFSMPETGIGFYPDVGGTYFLPRLQGQVGLYLGLTGARLNSNDCVALGIADQQVSSQSLPLIVDELLATPVQTHPKQHVSAIINKYKVPVTKHTLTDTQHLIDECFNKATMEDIMTALLQTNHVFCKDIAEQLLKKSPLSLKVTLRALREGKTFDFDTCMQREYRLTCRFLEGHDFLEGIRALIIDKDQRPSWQPPSLSAVHEKMIDKYFAPLTEELV